MAAYTVPDDVAAFVTRHIESIEQLEVLLLLARGGEWAIDAIAAELRGNEASCRERVAELQQRGFVGPGKIPDTFVYTPGTEQTRVVVVNLDQAYRAARYRVIELIFSKPLQKIKTFSDAFKLKKGD